MNPLKHMEVIFGAVVAAALLVAALPERDARAAAGGNGAATQRQVHSGSIARTGVPGAPASMAAAPLGVADEAAPAPSAVAILATSQNAAGPMPVVVIKGKRMSAREKRRAALTASAVAEPVRI